MSGKPRGYQHIDVPGHEDGFPVFLASTLTYSEAAEMIVYLQDSNYVDTRTKNINIQLAVYNNYLGCFGASMP